MDLPYDNDRYNTDIEYAIMVVNNKQMHLFRAMQNAMDNGSIELLTWLYPKYMSAPDIWFDISEIHYDINARQLHLMNLFKELFCRAHDMEKIKWFHNVVFMDKVYDWSPYSINYISLLNNYAIGIENIEMVKWKYELSLTDPRIIFNKEHVFNYSCSMNNLTVAKYIYELGDVVVTDTLFKNCNNGMLSWLCKLNDSNDSMRNTDTSNFNNNYYHDIIKLEKKVYDQYKELEMLKEQVQIIPSQ